MVSELPNHEENQQTTRLKILGVSFLAEQKKQMKRKKHTEKHKKKQGDGVDKKINK